MTGKRIIVWLALLGAVALLVSGIAFAGEQPQREENWVVFAGRPRLGVEIADVTAARVAELKLAGETGVVIEEVEENSPAAKAGLQKNDVILSFAGERVRSAAQLRRLVQETPPGRKVALEVSREGKTRTVELELEESARMRRGEWRVPMPPLPPIEIPEIHIFSRGARLGISGDEISGQLAEYFGVKQGKGVLVREVMTGSAAAKAGLKAGDVIVRVDDAAVEDMGDLREALGDREKKEVTLTIVRERREQTLKVALDEPQRVSPRRTAELDWLQSEEFRRLAAEAQAEAIQVQAETQRLQQQLHEERQRWQQNWRQQWQRERQKLEQELQKVKQELKTVI